MVERPKQSKLKEIQSEVRQALIIALPLLAAAAIGLSYLKSDREDNGEVIILTPGKTVDLNQEELLEKRYGICLSDINQGIQGFYKNREEPINSIEIVPLPWKGDLYSELVEQWQKAESELDGEFLFGVLFDSWGLLKLAENLPKEVVTKALIFVNFETGQDVLLQGKIDEEEVYLKATGLITDQNQSQIPTWAKLGKDGYSVWNPEKGQWEFSF